MQHNVVVKSLEDFEQGIARLQELERDVEKLAKAGLREADALKPKLKDVAAIPFLEKKIAELKKQLWHKNEVKPGVKINGSGLKTKIVSSKKSFRAELETVLDGEIAKKLSTLSTNADMVLAKEKMRLHNVQEQQVRVVEQSLRRKSFEQLKKQVVEKEKVLQALFAKKLFAQKKKLENDVAQRKAALAEKYDVLFKGKLQKRVEGSFKGMVAAAVAAKKETLEMQYAFRVQEKEQALGKQYGVQVRDAERLLKKEFMLKQVKCKKALEEAYARKFEEKVAKVEERQACFLDGLRKDQAALQQRNIVVVAAKKKELMNEFGGLVKEKLQEKVDKEFSIKLAQEKEDLRKKFEEESAQKLRVKCAEVERELGEKTRFLVKALKENFNGLFEKRVAKKSADLEQEYVRKKQELDGEFKALVAAELQKRVGQEFSVLVGKEKKRVAQELEQRYALQSAKKEAALTNVLKSVFEKERERSEKLFKEKTRVLAVEVEQQKKKFMAATSERLTQSFERRQVLLEKKLREDQKALLAQECARLERENAGKLREKKQALELRYAEKVLSAVARETLRIETEVKTQVTQTLMQEKQELEEAHNAQLLKEKVLLKERAEKQVLQRVERVEVRVQGEHHALFEKERVRLESVLRSTLVQKVKEKDAWYQQKLEFEKNTLARASRVKEQAMRVQVEKMFDRRKRVVEQQLSEQNRVWRTQQQTQVEVAAQERIKHMAGAFEQKKKLFEAVRKKEVEEYKKSLELAFAERVGRELNKQVEEEFGVLLAAEKAKLEDGVVKQLGRENREKLKRLQNEVTTKLREENAAKLVLEKQRLVKEARDALLKKEEVLVRQYQEKEKSFMDEKRQLLIKELTSGVKKLL